ncbi:MAG: hypothetical protein A2998_00435 [Candidatus Staskawiczbacteria bacterium RIFCSPLOWO2_01_FULL_37_25b]|uniref:Uncharacterized protein n=2 Tax=Candidatus Staskawicziibacteriota TaxID=1817916 RepID=A0A1G2HJM7_9BACT|nr:MAG: hypothetical protein A2812_00505 [Candidatus Staskawiczbacteria bacterium RIFCSPHIGHO2_01_FULL_36_16]OGZ71771.1 MAG: hypothetical protein A2998_00435 [Candidatus Staskawiczbacteria bacterium RIFCSPLOWO2_01_FULL_37_25b]
MQKQKGISTLVGIIIVVIVAVALFGGVFAYQYYTIKNNNQPQVQSEQQNQNLQGQENLNNAYIKVISPNGGEIFSSGEKITIKWESEKVSEVSINAYYYDVNGNIGVPDGSNYSFNEGQCRLTYEPISASEGIFVFDQNGRCGAMPVGERIKIVVRDTQDTKIRDESDNYFSIK